MKHSANKSLITLKPMREQPPHSASQQHLKNGKGHGRNCDGLRSRERERVMPSHGWQCQDLPITSLCMSVLTLPMGSAWRSVVGMATQIDVYPIHQCSLLFQTLVRYSLVIKNQSTHIFFGKYLYFL